MEQDIFDFITYFSALVQVTYIIHFLFGNCVGHLLVDITIFCLLSTMSLILHFVMSLQLISRADDLAQLRQTGKIRTAHEEEVHGYVTYLETQLIKIPEHRWFSFTVEQTKLIQSFVETTTSGGPTGGSVTGGAPTPGTSQGMGQSDSSYSSYQFGYRMPPPINQGYQGYQMMPQQHTMSQQFHPPPPRSGMMPPPPYTVRPLLV